MQPWIETTLAELQKAAELAEAQFKEAEAIAAAAMHDEDDARRYLNACHQALSHFKDYVRRLPEGGAP